MRWYPAALLKLVLPAIIIGAALWGRLYLPDYGTDSRILLDYLPYFFCIVAILIAYQFNRCRLIIAAVAVGVFYWSVQMHLQASLDEIRVAEIYLSASLSLSVLTFYLLILPERGVLNLYGLCSVLGFLVLGFLTIKLSPLLAQANTGASQYYAPWVTEGFVMSFGATVLACLVSMVGIGVVYLRGEEADAAIFSAFFAMFLALGLLHYQDISVAMSLAASLILLWGLLRSSHAMAYRDELTGLPGRRALNERLKMLGRSYSIAMLDVDRFKRFNDTYGHDVGDEVLRLVASRIRSVGSGGTAYRYGGEEFCIVFPRKDVEDCIDALERVREEIANYQMSLRDRSLRPEKSRDGSRRRGATRLGSEQVSVTISAGLAARNEEFVEPESVMAQADNKLYKAKKAGRNRVVY